jgi:hypothetical protein
MGTLAWLLEDNVAPTEMFGVNADALLDVRKKYDPEDVISK